jgi:hypothetical protein
MAPIDRSEVTHFQKRHRSAGSVQDREAIRV